MHTLLRVLLISLYVSNMNLFAGISLTGNTGLLNIPVAAVVGDGFVFIGYTYVSKEFSPVGNDVADNHNVFFTIGYLPNLELSFKVTFAPGRRGNDMSNTYKDGSVSLKYNIIKQTDFLPAFSFGLHDFYSYSFSNALYIVADKSILNIGLHLGYGVDWIKTHWGDTGTDRNAPVPHHLVGLFSGVDVKLNKKIDLVVEYDTDKLNYGIRLGFLKHSKLLIALLNFDTFSGGLSYGFKI